MVCTPSWLVPHFLESHFSVTDMLPQGLAARPHERLPHCGTRKKENRPLKEDYNATHLLYKAGFGQIDASEKAMVSPSAGLPFTWELAFSDRLPSPSERDQGTRAYVHRLLAKDMSPRRQGSSLVTISSACLVKSIGSSVRIVCGCADRM